MNNRMNSKDIRMDMCLNRKGAETVSRYKKSEIVQWLIRTYNCTKSTAYYLADEIVNRAWTFNRKGFDALGI